MKAEGRGVRARHRGAHRGGDRGQGRRQGGDPRRRHHLGRLDRRRLRPRRGAQGGARGDRRRARRASSRCSRPTCCRSRASRRATSRPACASPRTCARARAPWTCSSSRCCRGRRSSCAARARSRWRSPSSAGGSASPSRSCVPAAEQAAFAEADRRIEGFALPVDDDGPRFVVVSTQGRGDEAALQAALGDRRRLRGVRRQPQEGRGAAPEPRRARRRARAARPPEGAGRPRPRRHHAGRDRDLDPRRDHRGAPRRPSARCGGAIDAATEAPKSVEPVQSLRARRAAALTE